MKTLYTPFAELAIRLKRDHFLSARVRLTALYLFIVALIMALLSGVLYAQVTSQLRILQQAYVANSGLNKETAEHIANTTRPKGVVTDSEVEFIGGTPVYVVELIENEQEIDVYVDARDGAVIGIGDEQSSPETFADGFLNDLEKNILIANFFMLVLAGIASYLVAGYTLRPIRIKVEQQEQFVGDTAHELRTPLSAMQAALESVLRKNETPEAYRLALQGFAKETKRLIALSEDLLHTAKATAHHDKANLSLREIIDEVEKKLAPYATARGVRIHTNLSKAGEVRGVASMLERLFLNIIHNAIKFSHQGGEVIIEAVTARTITISDTGIGIPLSAQKKIFDRFFIADSARTEKDGRGAGLGLSIVRQIADVHHATVKVSSQEGKGTVFTVTFLQ